MTDSCLVQVEQMTSLTPGISFCSYSPPPSPFFFDSILQLLSVSLSGLSPPPSITALCGTLFVLRVYVTFRGVSRMAVGRKLLASFQTFHTKATVHMQPSGNGKQYHKMSMEKAPSSHVGNGLFFFPPFQK